jgi:hypothetical protein
MQDDFRFFKLGPGTRLVVAGAFFAAAVATQVALAYLPGFLLALAGWFPLMLKKATNAPEDQGLEEWRPVPMAEVDKLDDALREAKKLRRRTRSAPAVAALAIGLPCLAVYLAVSSATGRGDLWLAGADAAVFLAPALIFGRIRAYSPAEIGMKMPCFRALLSEPLPEGVAVAPYIRFDKDRSGADVPEDLRIMFELRRPPADLVGIQVQAAINKGPNGNVPYLYAVVLTKGLSGPSYALAKKIAAKGFEVEPGGDGEYGTVVLRQETGGTGYETTAEDCRKLGRLCVKALTLVGGKIG